MCHSRTLKSRINYKHHRALECDIKTKNQALKNYYRMSISISDHMKNLQNLAAEIFEVKNDLSLIIMNEVFNCHEKGSCRFNVYCAFR